MTEQEKNYAWLLCLTLFVVSCQFVNCVNEHFQEKQIERLDNRVHNMVLK